MKKVALVSDSRGYMLKILEGFVCSGWCIELIPGDAKIPRNGIKIQLKSDGIEANFRIFVFKVTTSGRGRPHERRVELTTTYQSKLSALPGYRDVVIGVDVERNKYVGIDRRRLHIGGKTHNASSFFDLEGLSSATGELIINPRSVVSDIFPSGIEYHAFFDQSRMAEYLFNLDLIHAGSYSYGGVFSGPKKISKTPVIKEYDSKIATGDTFVLSARFQARPLPSMRLVEAFESKNYSSAQLRKISPAALRVIQSLCEEVGALGEQYVLNSERNRLSALGHDEAAAAVERISLRSVGEGYDIDSYEDDGITPRYIEVKATVGDGMVVDLSAGEWRAAQQYGDRYYVARVIKARTAPKLIYFRNPFKLEKEGLIKLTPNGWRIDLSLAV